MKYTQFRQSTNFHYWKIFLIILVLLLNTFLFLSDFYVQFRELLQAGSSANWQDILETATGSREMDASAITEYFVPLVEYLDQQQAQLNYSTKWRTDAWMERYSPN